jgi:hypothetical protein
MAILWVRRVEVEGGVADHGANHFHSKYIVKSDDPNELRSAVLACTGIPHYGAPHPENLTAICCKVDARKRREAPLLWDVDAEWNTVTASGRDPADQQKQPDERRPKWRAKFIEVPISVYHDRAGTLLADKAGTPFDPAPEQLIYIDEISIIRYEPYCDRAFQRGYLNATNTDSWLGAEAGTALVKDIAVDEEYMQGAYWFITTYLIWVKPRYSCTGLNGTNYVIGGFDPEYVLNAGPLALVTDSGTNKKTLQAPKKGPFYDGRPVFLDQYGAELPRNDQGAYTQDPIYLQFQMKKRAAFAGLDLVPPPGWFGA